MFGELITAKLAAIVAGVVVVFAAGWMVNGWRWNTKMQAYVNAQEKAVAEAKDRARAMEQSLQAAADTIRNSKDAEIKVVRAQLDTALSELRNRPVRGANVSPTAGAKSYGTGAQLYREDAEFLTREAARAQLVLADYIACYDTYNKVRSGTAK